MAEPIFGYWVKTKERCHLCNRPRDRMYEIREGPVIGRFCGRYCYEKALDIAKKKEKDPNYVPPQEETDVSYW